MRIESSIITPRLRLRAYEKDDMDFCMSIWCDEEAGKYMSDPAMKNVDEKYLAAFDGMEDDPDGYFLIAEFKDSGERAGTFCIFPEGGNHDIGYSIAKKYWRKGLGSEMLAGALDRIRALGGRSVTAEVADDNAASLALLHKFGFVEGEKKRFKKWNEERYFDSHVLVLTMDRKDNAPEG